MRRTTARLATGALCAAASGWVVVAAVAVAGPAGPAAADPMATCSTSTGVVVAVDFSPWAGNVERGCATAPATGYDALTSAGFVPAGDSQDGPAFVCRIDMEPPPSQDACITTPPASASWSYWYADAGQDAWTYSQLGAMSYRPPAGSVEAWTFGPIGAGGSGSRPTFPPSAVRATNAAPPGAGATTTTAPPAAPATGPGATPAAPAAAPTTGPAATTGSGTGPGAEAHSGSPSTGSPGTASPTTGTGSPTTGTGSAPAGPGGAPAATTPKSSPATSGRTRAGEAPRIVDVVPAAATSRVGSGSPVPAAVGAGTAAVLAAGGVLVARRRRRAA